MDLAGPIDRMNGWRQMQSRRRIDAVGWQRFQRLSLMAAVLLLVTAWLTFSLNQSTRQHFDNSSQALGGVDAARDYLQAALDAEAGARSFLLTGEVAYLAPYQESRGRVARARAELLERVGASPVLRERVSAMDRSLDDALNEMQTAISLYREQGPDVVVDYLRGGFGKELMDRVRNDNAAISMALTTRGRVDLDAMHAAGKRRDFAAALALTLGLACGIGAFLVIREHTLATQEEHLLRLRAEQAMRESREKSVFLANMSHEIRTPMNAIFGFTELLGDLVTGTRERHYVHAIRSSGESLLALINDILDLSRIESGRIDLHPEATDLGELLSATTTMFAQQITDKRLQLSVRVASGMQQPLMLDALRVRQVLFNLVSNAIKYTDDGRIAVVASARTEGQFVELTLAVSDTGMGIAVADQERIFEAFTQLDAADRGRRNGTGLGLSIVSRLMAAMGGSISVRSQPGQGSTFTAVWPRVALAPLHAPHLPERIRQLGDIAPLKVLAIDDIELNRSLMRDLFAGTHHGIEVHGDAPSGLARMREQIPDVVLLDLRMPGMDGREALTQIRADPGLRDVRVIAVTASSLLDEEPALKDAFDGYLRKPVTREALSAELARLFGDSGSRGDEPVTEAGTATWSADALDATARARLRADIDLIATRCARARQTLSTQSLTELERQIDQADSELVPAFAESVAQLRLARERFELAAMETALEQIECDCVRLGTLLDPPERTP
jgi:signal transduction histidine kinase/DNA-binding response OmpR family regulator